MITNEILMFINNILNGIIEFLPDMSNAFQYMPNLADSTIGNIAKMTFEFVGYVFPIDLIVSIINAEIGFLAIYFFIVLVKLFLLKG